MPRLNIGLRQARRLSHMAHDERLAFIAKGLPIILESARGFWIASREIKDRSREANVLAGFAEEEAAKILILMDIVRCPRKIVSSKVGTMVGLFYDHLARLIYAEAVDWKPMHVAQLREYVDMQRKAHYLEGSVGEYIVPNWNVARRESQLYADIEAYEDEVPGWNAPSGTAYLFPSFVPSVMRLVEALSAVGVFTGPGVAATAEIFGQLEFKDAEHHGDEERLTEQLFTRLVAENLTTEAASQDHVGELYRTWQLPMYNLEFKMVDVPLEELERERDGLLWAEIGGP